MKLRRFFVYEYMLEDRPSVRGMPETESVTKSIEGFLASPVEVTRIDLSPIEGGDHSGVMLTFGYEPSAVANRYGFRIFFARREALKGFEDVDARVNEFLEQYHDPAAKVGTTAVGSGIQRLVVVTAVVCRILA